MDLDLEEKDADFVRVTKISYKIYNWFTLSYPYLNGLVEKEKKSLE